MVPDFISEKQPLSKYERRRRIGTREAVAADQAASAGLPPAAAGARECHLSVCSQSDELTGNEETSHNSGGRQHRGSIATAVDSTEHVDGSSVGGFCSIASHLDVPWELT